MALQRARGALRVLERGWFKAVVNSVYERGEPRAPSLTTCSHAVFAVQGQTSSRWTTRTSGASSVSGASRSGWSRGTLGDKGASFGAGKITLTPHDLLRRLYMGDPAVLQLGRDSGEILIGLMMHVKPEDIPAAEEKQDFPSSLRSNEEWEIIEDEGGENVMRKVVHRDVDEMGRSHGHGTRKRAIASVWLKANPQWDDLEMDSYPNITVNGTPFVEYFRDIQARKEFLEPILMANIPLMIDVEVRVRGGGMMGQAGAAKLALARAIQSYIPSARPALLAGGCLMVDPRRKERKKPGRTRARRGQQWSKR